MNVSPVFAEKIGVEDELFGIAAAAGDDDETVLTKNRFELGKMRTIKISLEFDLENSHHRHPTDLASQKIRVNLRHTAV